MTTLIDNYPISSGVVSLSVGTTVVDGQVATIHVKLLTLEELLPTSTDWVTNNNLLPEIISRAALSEETTFSAMNELSHSTQDSPYHKYELQLDVASTGC